MLPLPSPQFLQKIVQDPGLKAACGLPPETVLTLLPLGNGEYNLNYRLAAAAEAGGGKGVSKRPLDLVLRIALGSQLHLRKQISYEYHALELLRESTRTPLPCYLDDSRSVLPWGWMVESFRPGRALDYATDLPEAAAILADIHRIAPPPGNTLLRPEQPLLAIYQECQEMAAHYLSWSDAAASVRLRLEEMLSRMARLPLRENWQGLRSIINTELNSGNFLIVDAAPDVISPATGAPGQAASDISGISQWSVPGSDTTVPPDPPRLRFPSSLVDWEKPLWGEPAQDLAHFLAPTTTFWRTPTLLSREEISDFLDIYEKLCSTDGARLRERFTLYLPLTCLRGVSWCAMAAREYTEPGRSLKNSLTAEKIEAYLRPEFLDYLLEEWQS